MNPVFLEFKRKGTCGIQKEIAEFLRRAIEAGKLVPGEQLPPLRKLAGLWNSNFFSLKLATDELTELGFLTKQQGRGAFVATARENIHHVGLYLSCSENDARQNVSFQTILGMLCRKLSDSGYHYTVWNDYRPEPAHTAPPEKLNRAVISGEVQAVAGVLVRNCDKKWFSALPIKKASIMTDRFPEGGFCRIAEAMKKCKRPAAIVTATEPGRSFLIDGLEDAGVHFMPRRLRIMEEAQYINRDWTSIGYHHAKELLSAKTRPDALLVYPDNMAPGIFYAVYESGIKVPEELLLVMHRNQELDYFSPFPVLYLDTRLETIAGRMFSAVTGQKNRDETGECGS